MKYLKFRLAIVVLATQTGAFSQFDGAAGTPGSLAIHKDSSAFVGWATSCEVERGYVNIADVSQGYVNFGLPGDAIGPANGTSIVSLGDRGIATLQFAAPIVDGPGSDFAIFENGFDDTFLELAFVEVSSNGNDFVRFPATSNLDTSQQIGPFSLLSNPKKLNNLAGKYRANYGTPFDLSELSDSSNIDLQNITHIRLLDVVGDISGTYSSYDQNNNPINDPYPTPFNSSGFDLDAVGVIHQQPLELNTPTHAHFSIYPNPVPEGTSIAIKSVKTPAQIDLYSIDGRHLQSVKNSSIISPVKRGNYIAIIRFETGQYIRKIRVL